MAAVPHSEGKKYFSRTGEDVTPRIIMFNIVHRYFDDLFELAMHQTHEDSLLNNVYNQELEDILSIVYMITKNKY